MAFDLNQVSGMLGQTMQKYSNSQGQDHDQFSHDDLSEHYQQFNQHSSPEELYNVHKQNYENMPPESRQDIFSNLVGALHQKGISPQQAGVEDDTPSPSNLAKIMQFISQKPELFQSILGKSGVLNSPIAKTILTGALSHAAKSFGK